MSFVCRGASRVEPGRGCQERERSRARASHHGAGRLIPVLVIACLGWVASAPSAFAQAGFGLHGGGTLDPDQGFFGMHFISNPLSGALRVHPGADLGFGSDVILSSVHIDFAQWFDLNPRWHLYFGGGPSVNIARFDSIGFGRPGAEGDSFIEVDGSFDAIVGFARDTGWIFEMRVGSRGAPDLRFGVGFTFP